MRHSRILKKLVVHITIMQTNTYYVLDYEEINFVTTSLVNSIEPPARF